MSAETYQPNTAAEVAKPTAQARLDQLGLTLDPQIDYRLDRLFPKLAGLGWKGAFKKKAKLIRTVEPALREMLADGESVLYVAHGTRHSFAEQYFMGIWASIVNQTVFVLTNVRLLMIQTTTRGKPKRTFWSIYYSQIDLFKPSWTGVLSLRLRDRKKLKFTGFPKLDRKAMPQIFAEALETQLRHDFNPAVTQSMENLCSYCYAAVPRKEHVCQNCGGVFWTPAAIGLRSLLIPSWGDICLKHYTLAAIEMIGTLFAWFTATGLVLNGIDKGEPELFLFAALVLAVAHGIDAALAYTMAGKGLHPRRPPVDEPAVGEVVAV